MSKKDYTIKALKKKLKKLKAELDALKGPGKKKDKQAKSAEKKSAEKKSEKVAGPAKGKPDKSKSKKSKSKKSNAAKAAAPAAKPETMKIVTNEPTPLPPPARIAAG